MTSGRIARWFTPSLLSVALIAVWAAPAGARIAATPGTQAWRVLHATNLGTLPARPMKITLVLSPSHEANLKGFVAKPHHSALTPSQFASRFGPSTKTVKTIRSWAKTNGLKVTSVSANRLLVALSGSSPTMARALHTHFDAFRSAEDGRFYNVSRPARLPSSFAAKVISVVGLSSLGKITVPHPAVRSGTDATHVLGNRSLLSQLGLAAPSLNYPASYGPKDFWSLYDAPASETGSGQQLAIITEGDVSQPEKDLVTFEQQNGLPAATWNQINVGTPSTDTSGDDEWDLDSQYSTGFAPGVSQLDVYVGPSLDDSDILTTINRWVTDDIAKQGSFSAGECDVLADVSGFTAGLDTVLMAADAQGQTMFSASGDTGSQCTAVTGVNGVPAGVPDTGYPASSPYGIGVGGTSVLASGPTEIAWYAGGGGLSPIEPAASFQSGTTVGGAAPLVQRGVPDVSLDADPESGYNVIVDGAAEVIGGTSASTPSWQGIWARAQAAHGGTLGFAGPVIYNTEPATAFNDITIGGNGLYTALPGYDLVTGRGTPDIAKFITGA